jgi:two-component sensor histidine kinase
VPGINVEHKLQMEHVEVPMETAVPCGIAVSELIMNCFKHAGAEGRDLIIRFKLKKLEYGNIQITISENGLGLPSGFNIMTSNSLGLKTVQKLIESQLGGCLKVESSIEGVSWTIDFNFNRRL